MNNEPLEVLSKMEELGVSYHSLSLQEKRIQKNYVSPLKSFFVSLKKNELSSQKMLESEFNGSKLISK